MAVIPIEVSGAQVLLLPFWIAAIGLMSGRSAFRSGGGGAWWRLRSAGWWGWRRPPGR
jgi:hypothetical protein